MPFAARLSDCTAHVATPLAPGVGSKTVIVAGLPAWRALPAGIGDGIDQATAAIEKLTQKKQLRPLEVVEDLVKIQEGLQKSASAAAQHGNAAAMGATSVALSAFNTASAALATTYGTASAVPGGEPAAATAYALGLQTALAAAASLSIAAVASMTDVHICPLCTPVPHGPGVVTHGSATVFIDKLPAARQFDSVAEATGGSAPIALGCPTVRIG